MKLKLLILLLFFYSNTTFGQLIIVTPKTQEVTVTWTHDGLDTLGKVEQVVLYNIFLQKNDDLITYIGSTPRDTVSFNSPKEYVIYLPDTVSRYIVGISAVDLARNESEIHLSTDPTAGLGGWYLAFDRTPPSKASDLMRVK